MRGCDLCQHHWLPFEYSSSRKIGRVGALNRPEHIPSPIGERFFERHQSTTVRIGVLVVQMAKLDLSPSPSGR
jgi:hypothetical protein